MTKNTMNQEEFNGLLQSLDNKLVELGVNEKIDIKAIGGFALMEWGVREGEKAYTEDIDTVTGTYSENVQGAIKEVSEEMNAPSDWLNNDNLLDDESIEVVESMLDAAWVQKDTHYKNINIMFGDIKTLTNSKIMASEDRELSGRAQDIPDLLDLIDKQEIQSFDQFLRKYPKVRTEYPNVYEIVRKYIAGEDINI